MLTTAQENKIQKDLTDLRNKLEILLTKVYGERFTRTPINNVFTEEIWYIDNLVSVFAETWMQGYYTSGIEVVIRPKDWSCQIRNRHIKKYDEDKIIKSINEMLIKADEHNQNEITKKFIIEERRKAKEELATLQEQELAPFQHHFKNLKTGEARVSYNTKIIRDADGTYGFEGNFYKIQLDKMIKILEIIES